ncbi:group III truncated hemoglobin [Stakelama marina]|uniref:Group III truncated hemoglobin n=1 Tax=Stakelama marina TaxID=2826939 RepID=A0A8T4ID61_9SPHN|nr:group III truncated hemoglobin [Stakelama marina]MBR0552032.1 group III truncated hemoglobin [Stakelama marina]
MTASKSVEECDLEQIIPAFYDRVRRDPLIGPLFNETISDWGPHLEKLIAFWSSVMLTSGRYKGNPMAAHVRLKDSLSPEMFDRWLALWSAVTDELVPGPRAVALQEKAGRIAQSLQLALWFRLPVDASDAPDQASSGR